MYDKQKALETLAKYADVYTTQQESQGVKIDDNIEGDDEDETSGLKTKVATSFYNLHVDIKHRRHSNYWLSGGRGSTKSSFVSIEVVWES
ncbi:hypothetical protein [Lactiplantibacillus paraplantarum]|uniref:hypothetical protein n=1 Tax=Lactiplantibacillus paraplantarum TaxID=60520 RepID=UPI001598098B|nr:hypothetical protein [Lactiplantibacillus paraplantarum]QJU52051.1 hypothetical protein CK401_03031 [Lactiplantibacillus paraplantarum]